MGVRVVAPARLHLGFLDLEGGLGPAVRQPRPRHRGHRHRGHSAPGRRRRGRRPRGGAGRPASHGAARGLGGREPVELRGRAGDPGACRAGLGHAAGPGGRPGAGPAARARRDAGRGWPPCSTAGRAPASASAPSRRAASWSTAARPRRHAPPPITARLPFPADWRLLLILDPAARACTAGPRARPSANCRPSRPSGRRICAGWC